MPHDLGLTPTWPAVVHDAEPVPVPLERPRRSRARILLGITGAGVVLAAGAGLGVRLAATIEERDEAEAALAQATQDLRASERAQLDLRQQLLDEQAATSRAQGLASAAEAEVGRLEGRFDQLEGAIVEFTSPTLAAEQGITEPQAQCAIEAIIDEIGLERFLGLGLTEEDPFAALSFDEQGQIMASVARCLSVIS